MTNCYEPAAKVPPEKDKVIYVCSWCNRMIGDDYLPMYGRMSTLFREWLESLGHSLSHGICARCRHDWRKDIPR